MTWEDARGGGFKTAARGAHMVAHHEQAKSRHDESHGLKTHGAGRKWLVGAGAAVTVAVVVVAVTVVAHGSSGKSAAASPTAPRTGVAASTAPSASAEPAAAVVTVADTQPVGRYVLHTSERQTERGGGHVGPVKQKFRWTIKSDGCTATTCTGTIASSSGALYTYVWDGGTLTMSRPPVTSDKQVCTFDDGSSAPLSEAAYSTTSTYVIPPTSVAVTDRPPDVIKGSYRYNVEYKHFGDCQASPQETLFGRVTYSATRAG